MTKIGTVSDLVREVKLAVQQAESDLRNSDIRIAKVELEIKARLEGSVSAGLKLSIVPIDVSAKTDRSEIQTITLELVPEPASIELFATVSDELRSAIRLVCTTADQASATHPAFDLTKATIGLRLGVTSDGNIKVVLGGAVKEETIQEVRLVLTRAKAPNAKSVP